MTELLDDGRWPVFEAPTDLEGTIDDGYGRLACFVSPPALEELAARFPAGVRARVNVEPVEDVERAVLEDLYEQVRRCDIPYHKEPWHPGNGQRVRDPGWVVGRGGAGTCLDLALLFAGLCLREWLSVSVLVQRFSDGTGHAAVAVQLGMDPGQGIPPSGCSPCGDGVYRIDHPKLLADDRDVVVIDVTRAARPERLTFAEAVEAGAALVQFEAHTHLVDVGFRQDRRGDHPLPTPRRRGVLATELPAFTAADHIPSQDECLAQLHDASGAVVLLGATGTGKTTLALRAASLVDHNRGWMVPATSSESVRNALAAHELKERGIELATLEQPDLKGLADAALERLRTADGLWVVVLDNADGGPKGLESVLQLAGPEHLVIVTTTAEDAAWGQWQIRRVPELTEAEVEALMPEPALRAAVAGTLVLLTAFRKLLRSKPIDELGSLPDVPVPNASAGAGAFCELLARTVADDPTALRLLDVLGWLPPDRTDVATLMEVLGRPAAGSLDVLADRGLVNHPSPDSVSVHRLLGQALRRKVGPERAPAVVADLYANPEVRHMLLQRGDRDLAQRALAALGEDLSSVPRAGAALCTVAAVQELHEARASAATYARAAKLLSVDVSEERPLLADCLHAAARVINQAGDNATDAEIEQARRQVARAVSLRTADDLVGLAKHEAIDALLRQRAAGRLSWGSDLRRCEYEEIIQTLERSWQARRKALGDDHPLVDRAYFNRAGVRIELAQQSPEHAGPMLAEALEVYETTLAFRRDFYGEGPTPLAASCVAGIALVHLYRAALGLTDPGPVLVDATRFGLQALDERERVHGKEGVVDVRKSARLLAKIFAFRAVINAADDKKPTDRWPGLCREIERELSWCLRPAAQE
jgi:hypothetical protein